VARPVGRAISPKARAASLIIDGAELRVGQFYERQVVCPPVSDKHNININSPTSDGAKNSPISPKKHFSRALTTDSILKTYVLFLKSSGLISKKKTQDNLPNKMHSIDFLYQENLQKIRNDLIRNNCSISDWGFFFFFWIKDKKDIG
jgi:hypothetical protein